MKISSENILDLRNPKFCSLEEALTYAKKIASESVWLEVIQREDLPIKDAFQIASTLGYESTWKVVISNLKMPLSDAADTVMRVGSDLWPTLLLRADVEFNYALTVAKSRFNAASLCWKIALLQKGLKPEIVVEYAIKESNLYIWNYISQDVRMTEYFASLSFTKIFKIAKKANVKFLWLEAMQRKDANPRQVLLCAKNSGDGDAINYAVESKKIISYLKSLAIDKLIILAIEMNKSRFWDAVLLLRPDMDASIAFFHLKDASDNEVWNIVLERKNVSSYIKNLSPTTAIKLAKVINHWRIWRTIARKENMKDYFEKMKWQRALALALSCDTRLIKSYVIKRDDIKIEDIVKLASSNLDEDAWKDLIDRKDFRDYFKSLSDKDALNLFDISDNIEIWLLLIRRDSLSPADIISSAKKSNNENVWNIARARADVKKYLGN